MSPIRPDTTIPDKEDMAMKDEFTWESSTSMFDDLEKFVKESTTVEDVKKIAPLTPGKSVSTAINTAKTFGSLSTIGLSKAFHFSRTPKASPTTTAPAFSRALELGHYKRKPVTTRRPGLNRMCFRSKENYFRACEQIYGDLSRKRELADSSDDETDLDFGLAPLDNTDAANASAIKYRRLNQDRARIPAERAEASRAPGLTIDTAAAEEYRHANNRPLTPAAEATLSAQPDSFDSSLPPIPDDSDDSDDEMEMDRPQPPPFMWHYYYVFLHGSLERIRALTDMAGTAAQRALAILRYRRPARVDTRNLTVEDLQKLKLNEWRKDRGQDVLEKFPFPDLRRAFDSPEIQALSSTSLTRYRPPLARSPAAPSGPASTDPGDWQSWIDTCGEMLPMGPHMSAVSYVRGEEVAPGRQPSLWQSDNQAVNLKVTLGPNSRVLIEKPAVRPISEAELEQLQIALSAPANKLITSSPSGDPLYRNDLATCFNELAWLNDEVINAYLQLLVNFLRNRHDNAGRRDKPLFHAFNSFFFSNLRDKGVASVQRWATRAKIGGADLLNVEMVFIPVHNKAHWTMIIVSPRARTIEHYDSLGKGSKLFVSKVKLWIERELGELYIKDEWKTPMVHSPQQDNGSDCGVFSLTTAKAIGLGIDPGSFGPADIPKLRAKIVSEIVQGEILAIGQGSESEMSL